MSSNSSRAISSTFGLIALEKVWTHFISSDPGYIVSLLFFYKEDFK